MFLTENENDYFHKSKSQQIRLTKYYFYQMNRLRQMYHVKIKENYHNKKDFQLQNCIHCTSNLNCVRNNH